MPRKPAASRRDGVVIRKGRPGFYTSLINEKGKRVFRKLEGAFTLTQARELVILEKSKVREIREGKRAPVTDDTFAVFADEFLKFQEKRLSPTVIKGKLSAKEYERQQGIVELHLKPHFGAMKLAAIRRVHVVEYIHARTGTCSDGTLIKEVNVLKRMFSVALDLEKITVNPAQRAPLPAAPAGRTRYLTPEEWHSVFTACLLYTYDWNAIANLGILNKKRSAEGKPKLALANAAPLPPEAQWLQQAVGLLVSMGMRRGELMNATLSDVDLDKRTILLRKTKNGKPRVAFINELAMVVLKSMKIRERKRHGPPQSSLFPGITPAQLSTAFIRACQRAGFEDFSLHDLRHCFASHGVMNGASLHDMQKLLGHSDPRMTIRYAHLSQEHLSLAAGRIDAVLTLPGAKQTAAD